MTNSITVADYIQAMPKGFQPTKAGNLQAVYQFQLADSNRSVWTVVVANQTCTVSEGETKLPVVRIQMSSANFIKFAQGSLNPIQAFQQGILKFIGDTNLANKFIGLFIPWASYVTPAPVPPPSPVPATPIPSTATAALLNGSFDDYQPYLRDGQPLVWKESQYPECYGANWALDLVSEGKSRLHLMDSGIFALFAQKYFRGNGHDYHIHGTHSQVITSRYSFDLVFKQTVMAQLNRTYTFKGAIVSYYRGPGGVKGDGNIFKRIGLDPTGGNDYRSANVLWGERNGNDKQWFYPSIQAKAQASAITVFIRLENIEKDAGETDLNTIHLDNFVLE